MTKVIFTVGISASGKSYFANEQVANSQYGTVKIVCRDNIRHMIASNRLAEKGYRRMESQTNLWKVWNWKFEKEVTDIWWDHFDWAYDDVKTQTIICADTNLNKDRLDQTIQTVEAKYPDVDIEIKLFPIELGEAIKRDNARPDGVGEDVIFKQWIQYHEFIESRKYKPVAGSKKAIQVDLDGTLCHMVDRGPFEWNKVGQDSLDVAVYHIIRGYYQQGYEIVLLSGRDEVCRPETEDWLVRHNVPFSRLYMRTANDQRKDAVIKEELFWKYVANEFDIEAVIDDRPQVTKLWYRLGLKLIHVGCPWVNF